MAIVEDKYIILPDGSKHYVGVSQNKVSSKHTTHPMNSGIVKQYGLKRDERVGYIIMPFLGSRYDDWFLSSVAKGTMRGSGLTPVIDGEASNVIRRLQMMVYDWVISYRSPFPSRIEATSRFLSQAEDGDGAHKVISYMTGSLLGMNSGFFYARLPLHLSFEEWSDFGGTVEKIVDDSGRETGEFLFKIEDKDFMANQGIWALDNLQIDPTGNPTYPMRIKKKIDGADSWVLVDSNYCGQMLGELGAKHYGMAGFWPCPLYTYFGEMGVMNAMVVEYNFEGFFNGPPEGIVAMTSADTSNQLANIVEQHLEERQNNNSLYYPGTMWISIQNKDGQIFYLPFKKPSEGFHQEEFIRLKQRRLALAFGLSLNFVTLEIGVGAVHQAAVADMIAEVTGIAWIRKKAEHLFNNKLTPPNIQVKISIPSSAANLQRAQTLKIAGDAVKSIQDAGAGLSQQQVIKTIEKTTGHALPRDGRDINVDDTGTRIRQDIDAVNERNESEPETDPQMSMPINRFLLSEVGHLAREGMKVWTALGTPGTIVSVNGSNINVAHDWDRYMFKEDGHLYAIDELFVDIGVS